MASSSQSISDMLLELCITELEDVAMNPLAVPLKPQPVVQETFHPYSHDTKTKGHVRIAGAEGLHVEFDRQCSTEVIHDSLVISDVTGRVVALRSGRDSSWTDVHVKGKLFNY